MSGDIHKGSAFNNLSDTQKNNHSKRNSDDASHTRNTTESGAMPESDFEELVRQRAAGNDNEAKENQLLNGDRATTSENVDADDSGE